MKSKKILFFLSLVGIFILIILSQTTKQTQTGTIQSIQSSNNKITIHIEDFEPKLILFDVSSINLKKGDVIKFQGKQDVYKDQEQIIIDKIFLLRHSNS